MWVDLRVRGSLRRSWPSGLAAWPAPLASLRGSHGRDPAAESVAKPHILLLVHISIPLQLDGCGNVLVSFCRALLSSLRSVDCSLAGKSSEQ